MLHKMLELMNSLLTEQVKDRELEKQDRTREESEGSGTIYQRERTEKMGRANSTRAN